MRHLTVLRSLNFAYAALYGLMGMAGLVGMGVFALSADSNPEALVAAGLGVAMMVLVVGSLGVVHLLVGARVGQGRGRLGQTILAAIASSSFPLGMAYAVYALWVCWVHEESSQRPWVRT